MSKEKKEIAGWVRIGLSADELEKLDEACKYDERCRADFVRIYALRAADNLLTNERMREMVGGMQGSVHQLSSFGEIMLDAGKKAKRK